MKKYVFLILITFCFTAIPSITWAQGPSFTEEEIRVINWLKQKFPHLQSQDRVWWRRVLDTQQKRIRYIMNHPNDDTSWNHSYFRQIKPNSDATPVQRRSANTAIQAKKIKKLAPATATGSIGGSSALQKTKAKKAQKRY